MTFLWIIYYIFNKQSAVGYLYCNKYVIIADVRMIKTTTPEQALALFNYDFYF